MTTTPSLYIGLMSGTSMDGVDAILARFDSDRPAVINACHKPYPQGLLKQLQSAASGEPLTAQAWLTLDQQVGELFASAALETLGDTPPGEVTAIGSHGQTLWHQPHSKHPSSWQAGDANVIAAQTGIPTVADFRRMDIAFGGQGAPLTPAFHAAMLSHPEERTVVLNLGGIANVTVLNPSTAVLGYDTGPANCLLDSHSRLALGKAYDENGNWAASGAIHEGLLELMLQDPYFLQAAPKSTGPETFNWNWVTRLTEQQPCAGADLQATLAALTAHSITQAIQAGSPQRVIACGGGIHNQYLMQQLEQALSNGTALETTADHGIDPQQVEALAFAWLAKQRMEGKPGNLPAATGASRPCLLGAIYQA